MSSVNRLLECGQMLIIKRRQLEDKHGTWLKWLERNKDKLGFGRVTAWRLMKHALNVSPAKHLTEDTSRNALIISRQIWGHDGSGRYYRKGGFTEWYTPEEYVELARKVLGEIDLDPASFEIAQRTVKARKYYTKEDDGLKKPWHVYPRRDPGSIHDARGARMRRTDYCGINAGGVYSPLEKAPDWSAAHPLPLPPPERLK